MSEVILLNAADRLTGWLTSTARREIGSLWGLETDLQDLHDTLSTIKAVLVDAEEQQQQHVVNRQLKDWLERLEDAASMADDMLDEFFTRRRLAMSESGNGESAVEKLRSLFSPSNPIFFRRKMARKIRQVKKSLGKIAADKRDFHFEATASRGRIGSSGRVERERDTHSFVVEENVIGRDRDKEAILELVLGSESEIEGNVSVIPIVGIGGLGKTTLAQLVFNDGKAQESFDLKLWVCVSNDFDVKLLLQKIIKSATNTSPEESLEIEQLQKILHEEINNKRYLLILDDVWNEVPEKWHDLKDLLVNGAKGSVIIVTSRSEKVARLVGTRRPYLLETLDSDESWSLFENMAFERGKVLKDYRIMDIARKIMEKCGGIPLAIISIGRMLYFKDPETEWSSFAEKELSKVSQSEDNIVLRTLKVSYNHLPSHLKICFAYCSIFPKYHTISVETLIKLWMAQGFIKSSNPSACLDELGREYFSELLSRSFFQEDTRDGVLGDILTCKMHDLVHDLAISVAGAKCVMVGLNSGTVDRKAIHLSFEFNLYSPDQIPTSLAEAKRIRSLLLPCQSLHMTQLRYAKLVCKSSVLNFKFLRMLDFNHLGIQVVPESVGNLMHLRYLDLSGNESIRALPNSITRLLNLQTLKLNYCYSLEVLPRDIKKLINLRHLEICGSNRLTYMPNGLGKLTNLRTLSQFVLSRETGIGAGLQELVGLKSLRGRLELRNLRHGMDCKEANFKDKHHLQSLILVWDPNNLHVDVDHGVTLDGFQLTPNLKEMRLEYYEGISFPSWFSFSFTNLVIFELLYSAKCQHLPAINQFHSLKILKLAHMSDLEYIMNTDDASKMLIMPSLRHLELLDLPKLKAWWRDATSAGDVSVTTDIPLVVNNKMLPSFPCLSHLSIDFCPKLTFMPLYPHVEECLKLIETSLVSFQQTIINGTVPQVSTTSLEEASSSMSPVPTSFRPLSKLRTLFLGNEDLKSLPDWMENLTSLKELNIRNCPELKSLLPGLQHLSALQNLDIRNCQELDLLHNGNTLIWHSLRSLCSLSFCKLSKLTVLPDELKHVTTLQSIRIWGCYNFVSFPDWIHHLSSLKTLSIWECPNLKTFPETIRSLTSLQILSIHDCRVLLKRCQKETGEDWPKINHIPHLDMRLSSIGNDPQSFESSSGRDEKTFKSVRLLQLCYKSQAP